MNNCTNELISSWCVTTDFSFSVNFCFVCVRHQMKHLEMQLGEELRKVSPCSHLHEAVLCYSVSWTNGCFNSELTVVSN